jgi:hypothetical protein
VPPAILARADEVIVFNGIDGVRKYYGDGRRLFFGGERCRRRYHDYYIDILLNQLLRKLLEPVRMASRISPLDDQVPTFLVPSSLRRSNNG